ncbi:zinc finger protein 892-like isoform X2 [Plodia interpunctella]|uniref:zinc finger protein 892-like isoform X2 n=1 Tax=Plodia interpunctella TaxID=58824 RepID=UPI002368D9EB|nr:zinc finger protein 211-like isoform X2 [Plodia interpunctella]
MHEDGIMDIPMMDGDLKPVLELIKPICRCCLSTNRNVKDASLYRSELMEIAGLDVTVSDGLPHWLCYECCALLHKAVRFKRKIIRAHSLLYEYLTRCAPFPIDAQDPELSKYASPKLCATSTLTVDTSGRGKMGFHKTLQHEKTKLKSELESLGLPSEEPRAPSDGVKSENEFSDFEDNIALNEFRSSVNHITDEDIKSFFQDTDLVEKKEDKPVRKKKKLKKAVKMKKRKSSDIKSADEETQPKNSIRKAVEIDPEKIRIVTLNPEEQVKQREEESKAGLRFPFQCQLCYKGFNFEAKLENHMSKHRPSRGPFECKLCHMYLPTSYSYSVHSLIHTRRYECVQCGRRMIDRTSILDHYKSQHEGQLKLYTCNVCGKVSNKTHRGHMRNHHSGDRPKCDQCGKTFVNKDSLAEHQQIHQGIKNYECSECGARFRTRTQIKHHQLKHSSAKDYYCVECDVRFKSPHNLRQHLSKSLKHKDKHAFKFECPRCDKRFDSERAMNHHNLVQHDGVRPHRCAICPAALATRSSLAKHTLAVHAGRRPPPRHVCDTCGKAFRGKSVLTNHVRTHTGEKPYACAHCGRKFSQRTAMRTHVNLVHLKLPRQAKMKEVTAEARDPKLDVYVKEDQPLVFDSWSRPQLPCDVYFTVTAGP